VGHVPAALAREVRRARRALRSLHEASDRAGALLTLPGAGASRTAWAASPVHPGVEPDLWALHVRYARRRDEATLAVLVAHYRAYAEAQARRHYRRAEPLDDLTQVAYEALVLALQRFEPDRRRPFLAFAKPTIVGSLRRHVRDAGWAIRVPRRVHELAGPIRDATELLSQDLGRPPTPDEVADVIGIDVDEVLEATAAEDARATRSLDAPDRATGLPAEELVGRLDRGFLGIENRTALQQSLERLSDEDRMLLQRYFVEEMSQTAIAETLGCSQMQVSRLLRKAVRTLRRHMLEPDGAAAAEQG
jgi:RNA polymerase sigma-B factor